MLVTAASELTGDAFRETRMFFMIRCIYLQCDFNMEEWEKRLQRYDVPMFSWKSIFQYAASSDFFYFKAGVVINHGVLIKGRINKDHIRTKFW